MNVWIERLGIPSIISAIVGGLVGFWSANYVDRVSKLRTAKLDQIVRFTSSNDGLLSGVSNYISVMAAQKDITPAQKQLNSELSKQIVETENLRFYFETESTNVALKNYQQNLSEFLSETKEASGPTKMSRWVGSFDKVVASRKILTQDLLKSVDIGM